MNDTTNAHEATATHPAGRPPLRRPHQGRVLAGVAAGIADHLGVDVAIVRILVVVATLVTGGFGILVYLVAILVIPAATEQEERGAQAARAAGRGGRGPGQQDSGFWIGVGLLVVGVLWLFGGAFSPLGLLPRFGADLVWPLILIGFGLALWKASDRRVVDPSAARPPVPGSPPSGPPPGDPRQAAQWRSSRPPSPPSPSPSPPSPSPQPESPASRGSTPPTTPPPAAHLGRPTDDTYETEKIVKTQQTARLDAAPAGSATPNWSEAPGGPPAGHEGGSPPPPSDSSRQDGDGAGWTPPSAPRGSLLTRITLGAALVTAGVLWLLGMADLVPIGASRIVAAVLLVVGLGLLVGSWFGRGRWLILVGGILLPIVVLAEILRPFGFVDVNGADLRGGFGEIVTAPADLDELESSYRLTAGSIHLDLRDLVVDEATEVSLSVGAGEVVVRLPPDVTADVTARVGIGEHRVDDRTSTGAGVPTRRYDIETGDGSELLTLHIGVGLGQARVDAMRLPGSSIEPADADAIGSLPASDDRAWPRSDGWASTGSDDRAWTGSDDGAWTERDVRELERSLVTVD